MSGYRDDLVDWLFHRYRHDTALEPGKMMGHPGLKFTINGKYFVFVYDDGFTLKLPEKNYTEALERDDVEPFKPMGMNKPMSTWIVWSLPEPEDYAAEWEILADRAYRLVASEPPNSRKQKRLK
ncbi:MAG: hypothetical protein V2A56_01865 [bacterium]